jgi:FAD/FMN-containing dehydrogenase
MREKAVEYIYDSLVDIVGKENVVTEERELRKYGKDQSFTKPRNPLFAAKPASMEEVQQIVMMANRERVAIFPYSSGTNLQGGHIPTERGITIDLSKMKRIHKIDTISRNAIIEPGVTFAQLQDEVQKYGLKVLTAPGVPAYGSVLATYLDLTPLYSWCLYSIWQLLNIEMVLPTGEIMKTGQWAVRSGADTPFTWVTQFTVINRMFIGAQGTYGVATAGAINLKTLHEVRKVIFIPFQTIEEAIKAVFEIRSVEIGEETFIANPLYLSLMLADRSPEEFETYRKNLSPWTVILVISGWQEEAAYQEEDLRELALNSKFELLTELPGIPDAGEKILREILYPRGNDSQRLYKGVCNPIFTYVLPKQIWKLIGITEQLAKEYQYPSRDIGFFFLPLDYARGYYFEPSFHRNPEDISETEKVRTLFNRVSEALFQEGAIFDRPYGAWAEMVYNNAGKFHRKIREIKHMLDPENIMNPGKLAFYRRGVIHG